MFWKPLACAAAVFSVVAADPAPESHDSPVGASYRAKFDKGVEGYVNFSSKNGSVLVDVNLSGLPDYGGPFMYHIHELPVPLTVTVLAPRPTLTHTMATRRLPRLLSWRWVTFLEDTARLRPSRLKPRTLTHTSR